LWWSAVRSLPIFCCQAAELEHALMCQYLCAAFSLKSTAGPGLRADKLEAVERWRRVIFAIAGEEMPALGHGPEPASRPSGLPRM